MEGVGGPYDRITATCDFNFTSGRREVSFPFLP